MKFARICVSFCFLFCMATCALAANFTVTKTADTSDGACDADCSLREAVAAANAAAGNDSVYFALPFFGSAQTITLTMGEIVFGANGSTTVYGTGANRLTISGGGATRIFASGANVVVNLHNLRFTGGNGVGAVNSTRGGAVYNVGGTMLITNSVFTGNSSANGGAMNNAASASPSVPANLTLINCWFTNNSATSSGSAIQNFSTSTMNIIGSTFSNNSTTATGIAGAIQANGTVNITNSTFSGNSAPAGTGGGVYYNGTAMTLTNTTIIGNSSGVGGGLHRTGTTPTLNIRNTIIANNTGAAATPDAFGLVSSQGNNIIGNVGTSTGWIMSDLQNMNPLVSPLGLYGGIGLTHALLSGSPAINGGQNCVTDATCAAANPLVAIPLDERGASRDGNVDIGSFEVNNAYAATLPSAQFNQPYNQIIATNVGSFTYTITGGTPPPGITVTTGNLIAAANGTPTQTGTYGFAVTITNGANPAVINYRLSVLNNPSIVPVTGRVLDAAGRAVIRAYVFITDRNGVTRTTQTNAFGYFYFSGISAGGTYTVGVNSKQYTFAPQTLTIVDATHDLDFTASP